MLNHKSSVYWKTAFLVALPSLFFSLVWAITSSPAHFCQVVSPGKGYTGIKKYHRPAEASRGLFILGGWTDKAFLFSQNGVLLNTWSVDPRTELITDAYLKKNGNLVAVVTDPNGRPPEEFKGRFKVFRQKRLVELNWEGKEVWRLEGKSLGYAFLHHYFQVLEDGTIFSPARKMNGDQPDLSPGTGSRGKPMFRDTVVKIDPTSGVVWEWNASDHAEIQPGPFEPGDRIQDFHHINSVRYYPSNPINAQPALLVSMRKNNTIALISYPEGKIIWQIRGLTSKQHSAHLLPNGNILVFDNGNDIQPVPHSRILEIDPRTNLVAQEFPSKVQDVADMAQFFVPFMGSVEPMPNGNYFVNATGRGYFFELNPNGKLVWDMFNPRSFASHQSEKSIWTNDTRFGSFYPVNYLDTLPLSPLLKFKNWLAGRICH